MTSIPKIIHYCWFGNNPLPENVRKCIASWEKYCPDFEIKQWNESNYDVNKYDYTREAYDKKKYAFVSDVARLDIVSNFGGIYLDTDVELIKPLTLFLDDKLFMGMELPGRISTGNGFGAIKGHHFIQKNLAEYKNRKFVLPNGHIDETSCVTITTNLLKKLYGLPFNNDTFVDDISIYSPDVFCPFNIETNKLLLTDRTVAIHHFDATWKSGDDKFLRIKIKLRRLLGSEFYDFVKACFKRN
ncbi:glycosyltransferase family 32 protein [Leuconostoc lactis]|uniref:glycosyltransferase family 32 protein n=1 Tax=Leuconostoc lactis TaxID=1246 RepID=UPI0028970F6E|nr:glycosyltransferase [Leuconostoc lactis]